MPTLAGTLRGPFSLGCAMLGALETLGCVHITPIGAARAGWRENATEPRLSSIFSRLCVIPLPCYSQVTGASLVA